LLRQARQSKGRHEQLADRLAAWFLPIVALIAVGAALWHGSTRGPAEGVLTGLAVLLIACPCALGIATPLAVWSAFTLAIRHGVLFRHGEALERLAATQHFCFDKTGTLTTGTPQVSDRYLDADAAEIRIRAATLASASRHVFSRAVARAIGVPALASIAVQTVPGRGVRARWPEEACDTALGSERWMRELGVVEPDAVAAWVNERPGPAIVLLAWGGCVRAVFALGEQLRPEARAVVAELKVNHGVTVLTGDQPASAERWRQQLEVEVRAGLLPEKKLAALQELREQGRRVAMVGDGINDSPALAASDVGIALGCGADIARDNADVCLLDDDLRKIPWALRLSRHTVRIVRQNLFWAFLYNTIGIGLACAGYLNPVLAALAMVASSLFVLVNSLRVQHLTFSEEARP